MGILSACSTAYISEYMGLDTLIGSIVLLLLLLNIWVWTSVIEPEKKIKPSGEFVETKKMVLMK